MAKDYYSILGVPKDATEEQIKAAYRRLAKQYHPDLHKGNKEYEEKFKEINEAYRVLSDSKARQNYDRFGSGESQGFQGFEGFDFGFDSGFDSFDLGDIFESFFGGTGRRFSSRRARHGEDLEMELEVTLEEVATGTSKTLSFKRLVECEHCGGSGGEPPSGIQQCSLCGGRGFVTSVRGTPFGRFSTTTECKRCSGSGKIIVKPCRECGGEGMVRRSEEIQLEIPAGVEDGDRFRLAGKGEVGRQGGPPGDLYVIIRVLPHPQFKRKGPDIFLELPIPFSVAALGGKVDVPTLTGEAELSIPPGTPDGSQLRLRGQGLKQLRGTGRGDLIVKISIAVPKKLSVRQRRLLEELRQESL